MRLKYISWLPAAIIMVLIFAFSSKPADNSNKSSLTIANNILSVYETINDVQYVDTQRMNQLEKINHIVRKGAHFSEYALLSIAIALHLLVCKKDKLWILSLSTIFSVFYAMTDEYHQTFIEGRSGQLSDVLIDASGAIAGALFFMILLAILKLFIKNRMVAPKSR